MGLTGCGAPGQQQGCPQSQGGPVEGPSVALADFPAKGGGGGGHGGGGHSSGGHAAEGSSSGGRGSIAGRPTVRGGYSAAGSSTSSRPPTGVYRSNTVPYFIYGNGARGAQEQCP
jgi:hypothetical protein